MAAIEHKTFSIMHSLSSLNLTGEILSEMCRAISLPPEIQSGLACPANCVRFREFSRRFSNGPGKVLEESGEMNHMREYCEGSRRK